MRKSEILGPTQTQEDFRLLAYNKHCKAVNYSLRML